MCQRTMYIVVFEHPSLLASSPGSPLRGCNYCKYWPFESPYEQALILTGFKGHNSQSIHAEGESGDEAITLSHHTLVLCRVVLHVLHFSMWHLLISGWLIRSPALAWPCWTQSTSSATSSTAFELLVSCSHYTLTHTPKSIKQGHYLHTNP